MSAYGFSMNNPRSCADVRFCVVPFKDFYKALEVLLPHRIKFKPYVAAPLFLMGGARKYRDAIGLKEKIDFIFDDQVMEKTQLLESWDMIVGELEPEERPFAGKTPIFRDDHEVLPQAGDMLAWLERNRWEHMNGISEAYIPPVGRSQQRR